MSAVIFHGAPGSYKSASLMWYEILPALRKGRLVVTNIEGVLPLEDIEQAIDEAFPKGAEIWRVSSQSEQGLNLWRNWFHWIPPSALIVMDEVQDIFPTETSFKPEKHDYLHVSNYKDLIPEHFYTRHLELLDDFKSDESTAGDTDDLKEELVNEHGHIIYPRNLKEAYMRHRKYQWDIINATPDITAVHKYIRGVCEFGYKHKYFMVLESIPYYFRRPRIHEHSPKESGASIKKGDKIVWKKIPLDVHKCYKSTATGNITKRKGANILASWAVVFPFALVVMCLLYGIYLFAGFGGVEPATGETNQVHIEDTKKPISAYDSDANFSSGGDGNVSLKLPFAADKIWFTGEQSKYDSGILIERLMTFTISVNGSEFSTNSEDLKNFGFKIQYINPCLVTLRKDKKSSPVSCRPVRYEPREPERAEREQVQMIASN